LQTSGGGRGREEGKNLPPPGEKGKEYQRRKRPNFERNSGKNVRLKEVGELSSSLSASQEGGVSGKEKFERKKKKGVRYL